MSSKTTNVSNTNATQQQQSQQQQTTKPLIDPRLEQFYLDLAGKTAGAVNQVDRSAWTGPVMAGNNTYDQQGVLGMEQMLAVLRQNSAPGMFTNIATEAASGRLMDPATNPTLRGMIEASTRPVTERLTREVLPGIDQNMMMDNAFGGDRAALTRGQAVGDWAEASGDIAAKINYDNYNRERTNQLNSAQLYQQGVAAEALPAQLMMALGEQQRSLDQRPIDAALMLRALNEQLAFSGLGQGATIMNSLPFVGQQSNGTSSSTGTSSGTSTDTTTTKANPITELVKGGLGVGAMLSGLGWMPFGAAAAVPAAAGAASAGAGLGGGVSGLSKMMQMLQQPARAA